MQAAEAFRAMDGDKDGFLGRAEFIQACCSSTGAVAEGCELRAVLGDLAELGLPNSAAAELFDTLSGAKTGFVSMSAWQSAMKEPQPPQNYLESVLAVARSALEAETTERKIGHHEEMALVCTDERARRDALSLEWLFRRWACSGAAEAATGTAVDGKPLGDGCEPAAS
jgi:hypothetical protein